MEMQWIGWGLMAAAMAAGLVAGVFLTFSDFVMRSLREAGPETGAEAMRLINRTVYRSVFLPLLLGLGPVSLAVVIYAYGFIDGVPSVWLKAGGLLYIFGVIAVTVLANVPMNKQLDRSVSRSDGERELWSSYVREWTVWNHIRTLASFATAACYAIGAILLVQSA